MRPTTIPPLIGHDTWRRFGALTVTCAILLGTEMTLRTIAPTLPTPTVWSPPEAAAKVEQMNARSAAGATGGVVFVGTSVMDVALDPALFATIPGSSRPAYNASLSGIDLRVLEWWVTSVVVPTLKPQMVVVGLSSHEVNPNDDEAARNSRDFFAAPAVRRAAGTETALDRLERSAEDWSLLFRYRSVVRKPAQFIGLGGTDSSPPLTTTGMNRIYAEAQYDQSAPVDGHFRDHVLRRFQVGSHQVESLRGLLDGLVAAGVAALLVDMPVTQHYIALHPHGSSDYSSYQTAVAQVSEDTGTEMAAAAVWDQGLFADAFHLNRAGSREFTNMMAQLVSGRGSR